MSQNIFLDPSVSSPPSLTPGSTGTGSLTVDKLSHFTVTQDYTAVCTAVDPFTVFDIIGSLDGPIGTATVGTQFNDTDAKIFLTINQGPILFQIGDTFEFSVEQGTDLTQQNLDTYDELPQKNFGLGSTGSNSGDHNVRFQEAPLLANRSIQDLKFTSKLAGALGNSISIEYIEGSVLTNATLTKQDLTFEAVTPGEIGNNISIEYQTHIPDIKASRQIQDIEYTSKLEGTLGNVTSVEYIAGGTAGSEGVSVIGNKIQVQIEDGVSTADEIRIAIGSNPTAFTLIDGISTGTGLEPQTTQAETFLLGGTDAVGDAGNEVAQVVGDAVQLRFESNVSTAQQVYDAIIGNPSVLAKVTPTITGTPSSTLSADDFPEFMTGGADDVGTPGNEIVNVVDQQIQITFVNSLSTAQQIKTAVEADIEADALVTVELIGSGQAEKTAVIAILESSITNGESFEVSSANNTRTARFYYRIDSIDVPPGTGDDVPIDINSGDSAITVAIKSAATINAEPEWNVSAPATDLYEINNADIGPSDNVVNIDVGFGQSTIMPVITLLNGYDIGDETQESPVGRIFLTGGLGQGTFSFNTEENSEPGSFYEGNAGVLVTNIINQGNETTQGITTKKGILTLDDDEPANESGDIVTNVQKTLNSIIQGNNLSIYSNNDSEVSWNSSSDEISATEDILIYIHNVSVINTIQVANFPITILDGESVWVELDNTTSSNLSITVDSAPPIITAKENLFRVVTRIGNSLLWWDNTLQLSGINIRIGEGRLTTEHIETPTGTIDGVNQDFVILNNPLGGVIKVYINGLLDRDFTYDSGTKTITMTTAPVIGQSIVAIYNT